MTTRAALYASSGKKIQELAEAVYWVPLLWLALLSEQDLEADKFSVSTNRKGAIARGKQAVDFLAGLFPELEDLPAVAQGFLARLQKLKAETLLVELSDHFGMRPVIFPLALRAAVQTIETQNPTASYTIPEHTYKYPGTGKDKKFKSMTIKKSRRVVCSAISYDLDGSEDESMLQEFLVGYFC